MKVALMQMVSLSNKPDRNVTNNNTCTGSMFLSNIKRSFGKLTSHVGLSLATTTSCEGKDDDQWDHRGRALRKSISSHSSSSSSSSTSSNSLKGNNSKHKNIGTKTNNGMQQQSLVSTTASTKSKIVPSKPPPGVSFQPNVPYPQWDYNWDGRASSDSNNNTGVTRHIILVRHGQYEMEPTDETLRVLTPLGREQASLTGQRLASLASAVMTSSSAATEKNNDPTESETKQQNKDCVVDSVAQPCYIKALHVSTMPRAMETADIIESKLVSDGVGTQIHRTTPDPLLSEVLPYYIVPDRTDLYFPNQQTMEKGHKQAEDAFKKYFHRATSESSSSNSHLIGKQTSKNTTTTTSHNQQPSSQEGHEFEVMVCHANIIRYFICRALQIPPEAWLRMSLFNCSITYLMIEPNGYVTARLIGDSGHIPYELTSFSQMHGYNWHSMQ